MPQITFDAAFKDLKAGKFAAVYFLQGDEPYQIDMLANFIEENAIATTERGFNQVVLYGKDTNMMTILGNARRFPMGSPRQVVMVKEAQDLSDFSQEKGREMLQNYCKKPQPTTILVFIYKYKKLDARTALAKTLEQNAVVVESKKLYDNQLPTWINHYFKEKEFKITDRATQMLAEYIGNDLSRMANEIDKMLLNFKEKAEINEDAVSKFVGISKDYNTFELQNALGKKENLKAHKIVNYFASNTKNNPIIPIIALLYSYFSKILLIHATADKSKANLAKVLGVNPFFVDDYLNTVKNYNVDQTAKIIGFLRTADLQSKGVDSTAAEGEILKELVFRILNN